MIVKWFMTFFRPRCLHIIFSAAIIYIIIYFVVYGNWFDGDPDGTVIDFSDAHRKELMELYRRERQQKTQEEMETFKTKLKGKNELQQSNEDDSGDQNGINLVSDDETQNSKHNKKTEGDTTTSDLDPDLADIFNDLDLEKTNKQQDDTKISQKQAANVKDRGQNLNVNYDDSGNVIVNIGALIDYHDKVSNATKILPKKTIPYKCWEGAFYTEPYLLSKDLGEVDFECMDLRVTPSTTICLYQAQEDVYISAYLRYNGIWEPHIVDQLQRALSKDEDLGLIDLGANLGQYALIAAKMGRKVFAVEPYSQTLQRFQKAAQMGDLIPNIRVLKNAITDERSDMYIHLNPDNMGDARVNTDNKTCKTNCERVKSILLSDIVPYLNFDKAVLKIDIQGFENVIFYYADHLFNNVFIPYIFMEWVLLREFYVHIDHRSNEKRDVEYTIAYFTARGYTAYSSITGKELNLKFWGGWPEDVFWVLNSEDGGDIFDLGKVISLKNVIANKQHRMN